MPSASDFPARGKILSSSDGKIVFAPSNTNYQLQLQSTRPTGNSNELISALIRAKARKIYSVPSGGGFIQPIFGPPKIIQGLAVYVDASTVVIRAGLGLPIIIELPQADDALDLESGPITVGSYVNAVAFPGATFELIGPAVASVK